MTDASSTEAPFETCRDHLGEKRAYPPGSQGFAEILSRLQDPLFAAGAMLLGHAEAGYGSYQQEAFSAYKRARGQMDEYRSQLRAFRVPLAPGVGYSDAYALKRCNGLSFLKVYTDERPEYDLPPLRAHAATGRWYGLPSFTRRADSYFTAEHALVRAWAGRLGLSVPGVPAGEVFWLYAATHDTQTGEPLSVKLYTRSHSRLSGPFPYEQTTRSGHMAAALEIP